MSRSLNNPSEIALRRGETLLAPRPPEVRIRRITALAKKGTVRAYLDIETASGFVFLDCRLMFSSTGKPWIAMAGVKRTNENGHDVLDRNGKVLWRNFVEFSNTAARDRFTAAVLDAIRRADPSLLAEGAP